MTPLPAGEKLPDYDDEHPEGVDLDKLVAWLRGHRFVQWGNHADTARVRDVLAALQAVGDATLVKNGTYRALRRDAIDVERLAAQLTKLGHAGLIVEHGGNPVDVAITLASEVSA